tara:strand:+ start:1569 stop:2540 length:972 start_codon:yes stop_codon:yes gene_type:complete
MTSQKFLIPDGIEYYTGDEAILFEEIKSSVLNIFKKYKYQLVITPIIDSINNLTNLNGDNLKNFTTPIAHSRDLGIRADITPQIARLDYQSYKKNVSNKYSYMGDIYRETTSPFGRSNPFQIGAEFFGNVNDSIDINLIQMCHKIILLSKTKKIIIDLNDSYFINSYLNSIKLSSKNKGELLTLISMKSMDEINSFLKDKKIPNQKKDELNELISLDGSIEIISDIKKFSKKYSYSATKNIKSIQNISSKLKSLKNVEINIDLSSIKSMDYESGFNYSFYVDNLRKPIAVGGRYDSYKINDKYTRNATGFSIDLKDIISIYEK